MSCAGVNRRVRRGYDGRPFVAYSLMAAGAVLGIVHLLEMVGVWIVLPMQLHFAYYPVAFLLINRWCDAASGEVGEQN